MLWFRIIHDCAVIIYLQAHLIWRLCRGRVIAHMYIKDLVTDNEKIVFKSCFDELFTMDLSIFKESIVIYLAFPNYVAYYMKYRSWTLEKGMPDAYHFDFQLP